MDFQDSKQNALDSDKEKAPIETLEREPKKMTTPRACDTASIDERALLSQTKLAGNKRGRKPKSLLLLQEDFIGSKTDEAKADGTLLQKNTTSDTPNKAMPPRVFVCVEKARRGDVLARSKVLMYISSTRQLLLSMPSYAEGTSFESEKRQKTDAEVKILRMPKLMQDKAMQDLQEQYAASMQDEQKSMEINAIAPQFLDATLLLHKQLLFVDADTFVTANQSVSSIVAEPLSPSDPACVYVTLRQLIDATPISSQEALDLTHSFFKVFTQAPAPLQHFFCINVVTPKRTWILLRVLDMDAVVFDDSRPFHCWVQKLYGYKDYRITHAALMHELCRPFLMALCLFCKPVWAECDATTLLSQAYNSIVNSARRSPFTSNHSSFAQLAQDFGCVGAETKCADIVDPQVPEASLISPLVRASVFKTVFSSSSKAMESEAASNAEAVADRVLAEMAMANKAVADKAVAKKAVADKAVADEAVVDNAMADEAVADEAVAKKGVADEAVVDNASCSLPLSPNTQSEPLAISQPIASNRLAELQNVDFSWV